MGPCYNNNTYAGSFFCSFFGQAPGRNAAKGGKERRANRGADTFEGGAVMRVKVTLACTECKQRNYNTKKNKKNDPDRLEMNKYCKFCKKHTVHRETK